MALADVGARQAHLGAERAQMQHLLLAHLVGHDEDDAIALLRGDQGEPEAGIAGGRLDHRSAGPERSLALGGLDHGKPDPVLDRAGGIIVLELDEEAARPVSSRVISIIGVSPMLWSTLR